MLCPGTQIDQQTKYRFVPNCADISGTWELDRTVVECVNFPDGCQSTPLRVTIGSCRAQGCIISRTDGVWKESPQATVVAGGGWRAEFVDVAIICKGRRNPGTITIVINSLEDKGRATQLTGTYEVTSETNRLFRNRSAGGRVMTWQMGVVSVR